MLLLSDSDEEVLLRVRRILFASGLTSISLSYREVLNVKLGDTVDALILTNPYDATLPERFCLTFHGRYPHIPIFVFVRPLADISADMKPIVTPLDVTLPANQWQNEFLIALSRFHGRDMALYRAGSARDHLLEPEPSFGGVRIHMTPIERNIYRRLIRADFHPVSAVELKKYCTKPGTSPILCNIATHIYHINRQATETLGYRIIVSEGGGYRLVTDEEIPSFSL